MTHPLLFIFSILALVTFPGNEAAQYEVYNNAPNTQGGSRFDREVGVPFTISIMGTINQFIWNTFQQPNWADRRIQPNVITYISNYRTGVAAYTTNNHINVSNVFFEYPRQNLKWEFTTLMYHEMTHVFQWGVWIAPREIMEGIADWMVLRANHQAPSFPPPGAGSRWNEGYGVTARFLEYCDSLKPGFVAMLNKKMRYSWNENFFVELLGKPVGQLWNEYQAKYHL